MHSIDSLLSIIVNALEDIKGKDILVYDTSRKTSAFTHSVVVSGASNRQTRALAHSVSRAVREAGFDVNGIEGTDSGEWVLVDCGAVVVHAMQPDIREYYRLEELWGPETLDLDVIKAAAPVVTDKA